MKGYPSLLFDKIWCMAQLKHELCDKRGTCFINYEGITGLESILLYSVLYFTETGFVLEERNTATVLWLISLFDVDNEDNKSGKPDSDYFCIIYSEAHGAYHLGPALYWWFRNFPTDEQIEAAYSLSARIIPLIFSEKIQHLEGI